MKKEIVEQLEGYQEVASEKKYAQKYGPDRTLDRGAVARYIDRLHPSKMSLRISEIIEETPSTKTIRFTRVNSKLPPFQSGLYITLFLEVDGIRTSRPYSISSSPKQIGHYDLTVRRVEGGLVSNYLLDRVKPGDVIDSSGPTGTFCFNPVIHDSTRVCIAGGSGITPFMSMIRDVTESGKDYMIYLIYGNRSTDDVIFHDEITRITEKHDNIKYIPVIEKPDSGYSGKTGYITAELIRETIGGDPLDRTYFLCGPKAMYDFCLMELGKLSVPARKIRTEMFGSPIDIWNYPGWPSNINKDDTFSIKVSGMKTIQAPAGVSLLASLEKNGIVPPSLCRSGDCSMCRIRLVSGKIYQPPDVPVRRSDVQFGYIHSCMSYPIEDLEVAF